MDAATIPTIRDGLFFTLPDALPRGRHNLSRDQVRSAQRERVLAAMTELLAARGYRGFGPAEIASRAGVSLGAFYDLFEHKDACVFAGYERFSEVLLAQLAKADISAGDRPGSVAQLLATYFRALAEDKVVARAYLVEIDGLGSPARERRRKSLNLFAEYIRRIDADRPDAEELSPKAYLGVVCAIRQMASDALDTEAEPDLAAIGADLGPWLADVFRER